MRFNSAGITALAFVPLILAASTSAVCAGTISTVTFDPTFFNYQAPAGFSPQGGMFELEPTYGAKPVYASWDTSSSATLSSLQSCLATSDTGGIGRFSVYLPTSATSPLGSYGYAVQAWGQNLIGTSSSSIVSASMPLGWYDVIDSQQDPTDGSMVYRVTYYTGSPADYIRPNNDPGTFSLGLSNVAAPAGNTVLYFNGANNTNPANPSTFPAIVYPGATAASGFDATLGANLVSGPGGAAYWATALSGSWSKGPWVNGVAPTYSDAQVVAINVSTTAALTVTLDVPAAAGTLLLGSGNPGVGYTLSGSSSNTLTFSNSANNATATISIGDGAHTINAPVILASNLVVTFEHFESLDAQLRRGQQHHGQRQRLFVDNERRQRHAAPQRCKFLHGQHDSQRGHADRERLARRPGDGRERRRPQRHGSSQQRHGHSQRATRSG